MCAVMRSEGEETSVFYQLLPLLCHHLQQQLNLQPWTDQSSPSIRLSHPLLTPSADLVFLWLYSPLSRHTNEDLLQLHALPKSSMIPSLSQLYRPFTLYLPYVPFRLLNVPTFMWSHAKNPACGWIRNLWVIMSEFEVVPWADLSLNGLTALL